MDDAANDDACCPYATEYPAELVAEKMHELTKKLKDSFDIDMVSHRAGRWGFDGTYAKVLIDEGYSVDCSVTPGVSWKSSRGKPDGNGGPDYTSAPQQPYFVDLTDVCRPGGSSLLEVPVTTMPVSRPWVDRVRRTLPPQSLCRRSLNRLFPPLNWLRPNGRNGSALLKLLNKALDKRRTYVELMLHSSELMPGGSPYFLDERSIEQLYADLDAVFSAATHSYRGATLLEFASLFVPGTRAADSSGGSDT